MEELMLQRKIHYLLPAVKVQTVSCFAPPLMHPWAGTSDLYPHRRSVRDDGCSWLSCAGGRGHFHADNYSGQNKNSAMIHNLLWRLRVLTGKHQSVLNDRAKKFALNKGEYLSSSLALLTTTCLMTLK